MPILGWLLAFFALVSGIIIVVVHNLRDEKHTDGKPRIFVIGVLTIVASLIGLLFSTLSQSDFSSIENTTLKEVKPACISVPANSFYYELFESSKTELQQETYFDIYKGKCVEWNAYVKSIDTDMFGTYVMLLTLQPPSEYTIKSDLIVRMNDGQEDKLAQYSKGDLVYFRGKLDSYGGIIGDDITVTKSDIISPTTTTVQSSPTTTAQEFNCNYGGKICEYARVAIARKDYQHCAEIPLDYSAGMFPDLQKEVDTSLCMLVYARTTGDKEVCKKGVKAYDPDPSGMMTGVTPTLDCYEFFGIPTTSAPTTSNEETTPSTVDSDMNTQTTPLLLNCTFDNTPICGAGETPLDNSGTVFAQGMKGQAIQIEESDVLSYSYNNNFNIAQGTVTLWFKPTTTLWDCNDHKLIHHQSPSNNANFRFGMGKYDTSCNPVSFHLAFYTGTDQMAEGLLQKDSTPSIDGWYYVATTWDSTKTKIYLNGELQATWAGQMSIGTPADRFYVGSYPPYGQKYVANGAIDELKIYNHVKSDNEIMSLYLSDKKEMVK